MKEMPLWKKNIIKFYNNKLALIGFIFFITIVLASIFAPLLTDFQPDAVDLSSINKPPSDVHIFGTDKLGRDVFARILYGGRVSILVGVKSSIMGALIGTIFGGIGGYLGGKIDSLLIRLAELFSTFPQMILVLLISSIMGQGVFNIIFVFTITGWMTTFRMVRNEFISLKQEPYVEVCRAFGFSNLRIIFNNILRNAISLVIIAVTINVAGFILAEAGLSFLGVGVPSDIPTWGNIINAAKSIEVIQNSWWLWLIPGLIITIFVLSINFIGDGLRDIMDPKQ